MKDDQIATLQRGGYLHDVGTIGVADVLQKPSKLTFAEYEAMKPRTVIGEKLCGELRSLAAIAPSYGNHHERRDAAATLTVAAVTRFRCWLKLSGSSTCMMPSRRRAAVNVAAATCL